MFDSLREKVNITIKDDFKNWQKLNWTKKGKCKCTQFLHSPMFDSLREKVNITILLLELHCPLVRLLPPTRSQTPILQFLHSPMFDSLREKVKTTVADDCEN